MKNKAFSIMEFIVTVTAFFILTVTAIIIYHCIS